MKTNLEVVDNPALSNRQPHLLGYFALLSYLFSWSVWPLYSLGLFPTPVLPIGTTLAALVVIASTQGRKGVRQWWRIRLRLGGAGLMVVYLVALGLVVVPFLALVGLGRSIHIITSEALLSALHWWYLPLLVLPYYLLSPLSGALGEEPAYCGFVMPYLMKQRGYSWSTGALIIASLWIGWHLPLFLSDLTNQPYILAHIILLIIQAIVYSWLYYITEWNVPLAIFFHATGNSLSFVLGPLFLEAGMEGLKCWWWGQVLFWALSAMMLIIVEILVTRKGKYFLHGGGFDDYS